MTPTNDCIGPRSRFTRKEALKLGVLAGAALLLPIGRPADTASVGNRIPTSGLPEPFSVPFRVPPLARPLACSDATTDYYRMRMLERPAQILPGFPKTRIWGYEGIAPGPTIMAERDRDVVVRHRNELPEGGRGPSDAKTSVHLHGNASAPQYDGYASDVTAPNQYKDYRYPNVQPARTLWYHDHGVHHTAFNAYMGLAGLYITHDKNELGLELPQGYGMGKGKYDVPLVVKDAIFSKDGQLVYDDHSESHLMGDVILVNGRPWPVMEVEPRKYRFRVLNASISRSYELALKTPKGSALAGTFAVIGTDGGLMPHPARGVEKMRLGMAERYEMVVDFAELKKNGASVVDLVNLNPDKNSDDPSALKVMRFEIGDVVADRTNNEVPEDLDPKNAVMARTERDAIRPRDGRPRVLDLERKHGDWTVNGETWHDVINSRYKRVIANPDLDDVEVWTLKNERGGWFHPLHIHLVDFKILDRNGSPSEVFPYEKGPKDVVYLGPKEEVRALMKFEHQRGRYMVHCHNLVHEDHDMMVQFEVGEGGPDPITAAPPQDLPEKGPLC